MTLQTQAYILSPDRGSVLLMHRNKWPQDVHLRKYLGFGGHVERDEDVFARVKREVLEESGLHVVSATLRGTVMWTGFGRDKGDYLCFMFRVDSFTGVAHGGNDEGTLEWVPLAELASVPMWTATTSGCPWSLTMILASSTASCPILATRCSAGATSAYKTRHGSFW